MLQRIQSVWLFLATATLFALLLFPYLQIIDVTGAPKVFKATGIYESVNGQVVQTKPFTGLTIGAVVLGLLPFVIIFLYKDRKRQVSLCYITIILILGYIFWLLETTKDFVGSLNLKPENYGIGVLLPSLAILFLIFAIKGIRKDEKLVKSADRLR